MPKEEIVNLALRRALFYPSAEIYSNSPSGFWDFGPDGETIRRKVIELWRNILVEREGFVEIHGCEILPEDVFKASGHLENFNDPVTQCAKCKTHHRSDTLIEDATKKVVPESMPVAEMDTIIKKSNIKCPKCKGALSETKLFNMMMKTNVGATAEHPAYLRPETCQSIFLDFHRLYKTMRQSLPFGIAQAGNSFRNEIAPRNNLLREREIGQMEIEIFFNPEKINDFPKFEEVADYKLNLMLVGKKTAGITCKDAVRKKLVSGKLIAYYLARTQQLYEQYGIPAGEMRFRELEEDARAFYAAETWDFEIKTDLGWIELIACNYRTDFDLKGHGKESKKDLSVTEDGKKFIPHVFELSAGIDRTFYVVLDLAFRKEKRGPDERIYLDLNPRVAPYLAGIFPLVKKDGLLEKAREIFNTLSEYEFDVFFDEKGSIGKRYARIDEIGVPYAVTVDYDTMKNNTVTLRDRTTMKQTRVKIPELHDTLWKLKYGKIDFNKL